MHTQTPISFGGCVTVDRDPDSVASFASIGGGAAWLRGARRLEVVSSEAVCSTYEWRGRTGPLTLVLRPGVFTPTHTTVVMADALEIKPEDVVIDVGCGSGVLGFVAARLGAARIIGCDVSAAAVGLPTWRLTW
ncbi:MAG: methyltransferase [Actinobacteria bacterium]|nr:MAG: methyltransferase [Actinomycetota bacterium]